MANANNVRLHIADRVLHNLRMQKHLSRLRRRLSASDSPVKVAFLSRENQKWQSESIYRLMEADPNFDPIVVVSSPKVSSGEEFTTRVTLEDNLLFFAQKGIKAVSAAVDAKNVLDDLEPDIVFYEQHWGLSRIFHPRNVGRKSLICYSPYSYAFYLLADSQDRDSNVLTTAAWKLFLASESIVDSASNSLVVHRKNIAFVGDPKSDELRDAILRLRPRVQTDVVSTVIYAPHHSVLRKERNRFATFSWSSNVVKQLAKQHPEVYWVFKPHPKLGDSLVKSGLMTKNEVASYYNFWLDLPNGTVNNSGDYAGVFARSTAMITDSVSFLVEYGLTEKPIIHLSDCPTTRVDNRFTALGLELVDALYRAGEATTLSEMFKEVVLEGKDPLRAQRMSTQVLNILSAAPNAGEAIVQELRQELWL